VRERVPCEGDFSKMNRVMSRRSILTILIAFVLVTAFGLVSDGVSRRAQAATDGITTQSNFCSQLGKKYLASAGAQMYCSGLQPNGLAKQSLTHTGSPSSNVNAADPDEDVSPSGARLFGQAEASIAASGHYVVEAWNDATSLSSPCGAPLNKEEGTGLGFSSDSGASFTDLGGLPNTDCAHNIYHGDPSVETLESGGNSYFYVASLFDPVFSRSEPSPADPRSHLALTACRASGEGTSALLTCSQPIIIASSSLCATQSGSTFCSFLDKEFLSIDPVRGLLYTSYTEFFFDPITHNPINLVELAVCDIGKGTLGGTAAAPVCTSGGQGSAASPAKPYMVVAPTDPHFCENTGAYPAVDPATGDLYVAYEHNWGSALFEEACTAVPVQNVMNFIPVSCLTLPKASCPGPLVTSAVNVTSSQAAFIPGYTRFPMNDFPRVAVSTSKATVSMVWNDTRFHPVGDILMQSFSLVGLNAKTNAPVILNTDRGGWHFMPALRNSNQSGLLNVSWYSRASANTAITDVTAAVNVDPLSTVTPSDNLRVTDVSSDWNAVSSDSSPNFGDYTDNYTIATSTGGFTGSVNFVAWTDGRLGVPQPFEANMPT
jgi:hypothetical protein